MESISNVVKFVWSDIRFDLVHIHLSSFQCLLISNLRTADSLKGDVEPDMQAKSGSIMTRTGPDTPRFHVQKYRAHPLPVHLSLRPEDSKDRATSLLPTSGRRRLQR